MADFTNINGINVKDAVARNDISVLNDDIGEIQDGYIPNEGNALPGDTLSIKRETIELASVTAAVPTVEQTKIVMDTDGVSISNSNGVAADIGFANSDEVRIRNSNDNGLYVEDSDTVSLYSNTGSEIILDNVGGVHLLNGNTPKSMINIPNNGGIQLLNNANQSFIELVNTAQQSEISLRANNGSSIGLYQQKDSNDNGNIVISSNNEIRIQGANSGSADGGDIKISSQSLAVPYSSTGSIEIGCEPYDANVYIRRNKDESSGGTGKGYYGGSTSDKEIATVGDIQTATSGMATQTYVNNAVAGYIPNAGNTTNDNLNISRRAVNINSTYGNVNINALSDIATQCEVERHYINSDFAFSIGTSSSNYPSIRGNGDGVIINSSNTNDVYIDLGYSHDNETIVAHANDGTVTIGDGGVLIKVDNDNLIDVCQEYNDNITIKCGDELALTGDGGVYISTNYNGDVNLDGAQLAVTTETGARFTSNSTTFKIDGNKFTADLKDASDNVVGSADIKYFIVGNHITYTAECTVTDTSATVSCSINLPKRIVNFNYTNSTVDNTKGYGVRYGWKQQPVSPAATIAISLADNGVLLQIGAVAASNGDKFTFILDGWCDN